MEDAFLSRHFLAGSTSYIFKITCLAFHRAVFFNDIPVACYSSHKHLGMYLHEKLNFGYHITGKIVKANKVMGVIKRIHNVL